MATKNSAYEIRLTFGNNTAASIVNWDSYDFASDFLIACDAFTMKISSENLDDSLKELFTEAQQTSQNTSAVEVYTISGLAGLQVKLEIVVNIPSDIPGGTFPLMVGFIDQVEVENSRFGTFYTLRGRNLLGPLCDSGIDPWSPTFKFSEGETLFDVIGKCFQPFNITNIWLTDAVNRQVSTGNNPETTKAVTSEIEVVTEDSQLLEGENQASSFTTSSTTITQYIDPTNNYDLSEKDIKKLQPRHEQTFMQFVEEHLARFHLHCWAMNDGMGVVIGTPDYSSQNYLGQKITNRLDGQNNNVIRSELMIDYFNQPSIIIAKGKQGGGDLANARTRAARVNEFIGYDSKYNLVPSVQQVLNNYKGLKPIVFTGEALNQSKTLVANYSRYFIPPTFPRVIFIEASNTATQHELEGIVNRKMAEQQKQAFVLRYTLQDHVSDNLIPWKHNTIVSVTDDNLSLTNQQFWVKSVAYHKSRSAGTTTDLTLIPIGSLQL